PSPWWRGTPMPRRLAPLALLALPCTLWSAPPAKVANFELTDARDHKAVSLAGLKDKKAIVVVFLGTECPVNNAFLPVLAGLHKTYAPRGVQFLAINSNQQDTPERVAAHAKQYKVPFTVLKDPGNVVADNFTATRT